MKTDMNQYLIFRKCIGMLINYCKNNDSLSAESLVLGKLTRHLCLQSIFLVIFSLITANLKMNSMKTKLTYDGYQTLPLCSG